MIAVAYASPIESLIPKQSDVLATATAQILNKYYTSDGPIVHIITKASNEANRYKQHDMLESVFKQLNGTLRYEKTSLDHDNSAMINRKMSHDHHLLLIDGLQSFE